MGPDGPRPRPGPSRSFRAREAAPGGPGPAGIGRAGRPSAGRSSWSGIPTAAATAPTSSSTRSGPAWTSTTSRTGAESSPTVPTRTSAAGSSPTRHQLSPSTQVLAMAAGLRWLPVTARKRRSGGSGSSLAAGRPVGAGSTRSRRPPGRDRGRGRGRARRISARARAAAALPAIRARERRVMLAPPTMGRRTASTISNGGRSVAIRSFSGLLPGRWSSTQGGDSAKASSWACQTTIDPGPSAARRRS
jgi:hypothetical protein